jgi:hypothetical protein
VRRGHGVHPNPEAQPEAAALGLGERPGNRRAMGGERVCPARVSRNG